jgi:hypothetical protein
LFSLPLQEDPCFCSKLAAELQSLLDAKDVGNVSIYLQQPQH